MITLLQFIFISFVCVNGNISFYDSNTKKFRIKSNMKAPFFEHLMMNIIFFVLSVGNNMAFEYGISQPFNVIFRSLSLLISLFIGVVAFNKRCANDI